MAPSPFVFPAGSWCCIGGFQLPVTLPASLGASPPCRVLPTFGPAAAERDQRRSRALAIRALAIQVKPLGTACSVAC
jgi:hypothetical protein